MFSKGIPMPHRHGFRLAVFLLLCALCSPAAAMTVVKHLGGGAVAARQVGQFAKGCAAGEVLLGGGYAVTPDYGDEILAYRAPMDRYFVYANYPSSASAWTAGLWNRSPHPVTLVVYVVCASGASSPPRIATRSDRVGHAIVVDCPAGTATGGGFRVLAGNRVKLASVDTDLPAAKGWRVSTSFAETDANDVVVDAFAVCNVSAGAFADAPRTVSVPSGRKLPQGDANFVAGAREVQFACKGMNDIVGAGFAKEGAEHDAVVLTQLSPLLGPAGSWQARAASLPVGGFEGALPGHGTVEIVPICVKRPLLPFVILKPHVLKHVP
jgi:hypothetical protein